MISVEDAKPKHVAAIAAQARQREEREFIISHVSEVQWRHAYAAVVAGEVIAVAGINETWPGRGIAWSLLSEKTGLHFVAVHRAVKRNLQKRLGSTFHRIEMTARADFPAAIRWARMLGFTMEGKLRAYGPDRADYFLFSMVSIDDEPRANLLLPDRVDGFDGDRHNGVGTGQL